MPIPCPPDEIRMSAIYNEIYRKPLISDDNSKLRILSNEAFISSGDSIYKIPDLFSEFCGYTQSPKMYLMYYDDGDNFIISHDGGKTWFPPIKNPVADDATSMRGLNNSKYWTNIYTVTHRTSYNNKFIQESTDLGLTWKNATPSLNGTDSIGVDMSSDNNNAVVVKSNNAHYLRESSFWNSTLIGSTNVTGVAAPKSTLVSYTSHNASPGIRRRFQNQWFTPSGTIGASASICCSDDGVSVFAGSMSNGIIYKSTTSGNNFSSINLGVTGKELHIYCDETGKYVLVRQHLGTNVWLSTDKGATFNNIVSKLPVPITTSHSGQFGSRIMSYSGEYMAIPAGKKLNLSNDYGNTWYLLGNVGAPLRGANDTDYTITSTYQKIVQTNPLIRDTYITSINYTGLAESDNSVDYVFQVRINGVSVSYDKNITINGLVPISIIWDYSQQLVIGDTVEIWVKLSTSIPGIFDILGSKTSNNIDIETYVLYEASTPIVYFSIEEEDLGSTQEPFVDFDANNTIPTTFDTVSFYDISQFQPNVWEWTINPMGGVLYKNGTNSSSQNPKINFSTVGTYDITLKAYNAFGDDTEIKLGYIVVSEYIPTPAVDFSADYITPTVGQTVNINDLSTNNPTSWLWDITWDGAGGFNYVGDTSNILQNIQVEFTIDGVYTITLIATNAGGSGVLTKDDYITVLPEVNVPIPDFVASDTTPNVGQDVTLNSEFYTINNPTSWLWEIYYPTTYDWINNTDETLENPEIRFTATGTYSVKLTATNSAGSGIEDKENHIVVSEGVQIPIADFEGVPVIIDEGDSVVFTDRSKNNPTSWEWEFEEGTPPTASTQGPHTIIYNNHGVYDVILSVSNSAGGSSAYESDYITVNSIGVVVADFMAHNTTPEINETIQLLNISTGGTGTWTYLWTISGVENTDWEFDGGDDENTESPHVNFLVPNFYDVTLVATLNGNSDTEHKVKYIAVHNLYSMLYSCWKLDETGNPSVAIDSMPAGNDGTLINPNNITVGESGQNNKCYKFEKATTGSENPYLDCGNSSVFGTDTQITFGFWIKINTNPGATINYDVLGRNSSSGVITYKVEIKQRNNSTEIDLHLVIKRQGVNTWVLPIILEDAQIGQWYFITVYINAIGSSDNYVKLYVNGILENTTTMDYEQDDSNGNFYIGSKSVFSRTDFWLDGLIFWNRGLVESEIYILYKNFNGSVCPISAFTANFSANKTTVVENNVVEFTDQSVGNPILWVWTISGVENTDYAYTDDTSYLSEDPKVIFYNDGLYNIQLYISDGNQSDSITKIDYITVINESLITNVEAYWKLDSTYGMGETVKTIDSTGNDHDAELMFKSYIYFMSGKIGTSFLFTHIQPDLKVPHLKVPHETFFGLHEPTSYSFWIYPNNTVTDGQCAIIDAPGKFSIYLERSANIKMRVILPISGGSTDPVIIDGNMSSNIWTHYVIIFNRFNTLENVKFYKNGTKIGSFSPDNGAIVHDQDYRNLFLGGNSWYDSAELNAKLDEMSLWLRELSEDDISSLYNNGNGLTYPF